MSFENKLRQEVKEWAERAKKDITRTMSVFEDLIEKTKSTSSEKNRRDQIIKQLKTILEADQAGFGVTVEVEMTVLGYTPIRSRNDDEIRDILDKYSKNKQVPQDDKGRDRLLFKPDKTPYPVMYNKLNAPFEIKPNREQQMLAWGGPIAEPTKRGLFIVIINKEINNEDINDDDNNEINENTQWLVDVIGTIPVRCTVHSKVVITNNKTYLNRSPYKDGKYLVVIDKEPDLKSIFSKAEETDRFIDIESVPEYIKKNPNSAYYTKAAIAKVGDPTQGGSYPVTIIPIQSTDLDAVPSKSFSVTGWVNNDIDQLFEIHDEAHVVGEGYVKRDGSIAYQFHNIFTDELLLEDVVPVKKPIKKPKTITSPKTEDPIKIIYQCIKAAMIESNGSSANIVKFVVEQCGKKAEEDIQWIIDGMIERGEVFIPRAGFYGLTEKVTEEEQIEKPLPEDSMDESMHKEEIWTMLQETMDDNHNFNSVKKLAERINTGVNEIKIVLSEVEELGLVTQPRKGYFKLQTENESNGAEKPTQKSLPDQEPAVTLEVSKSKEEKVKKKSVKFWE